MPPDPNGTAPPAPTRRLRFRAWAEDDIDAVHELYGDPEVMRWVGGGPSRDLDHSRRRLDWLVAHERTHGFGLWAVEEHSSGEVVGDCGVVLVEGSGPEIEIAYKLVRSRWGRGYATEAAAATLSHAFERLALAELVAFAFPENRASRAVLEKIGMRGEPDEERYGHRLARYRLTRDDWLTAHAGAA
jgi:RimJ/RimL family protein N-acetyltransferase